MRTVKTPNYNYWSIYKEISDAPHCLIAGTTGAGKSVALAGVLHALTCSRTPGQAQLHLIDPKKVELYPWTQCGTFCGSYAETRAGAVRILDMLSAEMGRRYDYMKSNHLKMWRACDGPAHYVIIDELADLMSTDGNRDEQRRFRELLTHVLRLGRAADIHVIAATQSPNRQTIPADIVMNFTHRLALRCLSQIESRQIVQIAGAEKLTGYGKGIFLSPSAGLCITDVPMVEQADIDAVINYWKDI